jgi:hypothetical protein
VAVKQQPTTPRSPQKKEEEKEEGQITPIHTTDCQGGPGHSLQPVEQAGGEQGREESSRKTEEGWVSIGCKIIPSSPLSQETRSRPCFKHRMGTGAWKAISNQLWRRTFSPITLYPSPKWIPLQGGCIRMARSGVGDTNPAGPIDASVRMRGSLIKYHTRFIKR